MGPTSVKSKSKESPPLLESKLRKSELRYRRLFEAAQDGIMIVNAETGTIEDVNPYLLDILGYNRKEFIKKKLWEIGAFKDIEASHVAFEALQKNKFIRYDDLPLKTKSGKLLQVEFVSNLYVVGDEKVLQCNIRDITERKLLANEMAETEKKYTDLVNQSPDGIFIIDLGGQFLSVNDALCHGLGFSHGEFLKLNIQDIVPEQYLDKYEKWAKRIIKGKNFDDVIEFVLRGKDEKVHFMEVVSSPYYRAKKIVGIQGIARDITTRKRAEDALQSSKQLVEGIINAIPVSVFWKDKNLNYIGCNAIFARDLGFKDPTEIIGKDDYQLPSSDRAELYRNDDRQVIEGGLPKLLIEEKQTSPEGKINTLLSSKVPLRNSSGEIIGILGSYMDITERKQAEEDLRQSTEMIVKLTAMVPGVVYQFRSWPDGRSAFPFSSPGMNDIYEVTPEEVREDATSVYSRLHPDDYDRIVESIAESARNLSPYHCEYRVILPRQGLRWRLADALPERMEDGSTLWYGIISDISERKIAEAVLERERRDYQSIIDTAPVMVAYKSKDDHFIKVNSAFADFVGLPPEQIIGKTTFELVKQQDVAQLGRDSDLEVMRSGKPILNKLTKWSGFSSQKEIWATFSKIPFKDADGNIIGTLSFVHDVDDRVKAENALRSSEERFRALIENSSDAITLLDAEGKTIYDSPAAPGMLGYGPEDWIGRNVFELLHPDDLTRMLGIYQGLVRTPGKRLSDTFRVRHKNGSWIWLEMVATNLISDPSVAAIVLNYHDITERKLAEDKLQKSEEHYRSLFENMLNGYASCQMLYENGHPSDFIYLDVNKSFESLTGLKNVTGKKVSDVIPGIRESDIPLLEIYSRVALTGKPESFEMYVKSLNDWYSISVYSPKREFFVAVFDVITARKLAEERLIQANKRLSLAQHSSRTGVWDWDIITGKLEWSAELFELFGLDVTTIPTFEVWRNVMHTDDVQAAGDRIEQAIREHKPLANEYRIVLPSGELLWINALGDTIYNDQGEPQRMSGICIDITERKRVEQKIQRQFEHLNSLGAIDRVITTNFDLELSLSEILNHVTKELEVDAADILLLDPISDMLEFAAKRGFNSKSVKNTHLRLGECYAGRAVLERKLVHIPNLKAVSDSAMLATIAVGDNFTSYFGIPLINKGKVRGVLEVFHRKPLEPDAEWFEFLNSLAGQTAIAIENASLYESQQRTYQELTLAYDATIEGWSRAMDLRDRETEGHTQRVTDITLILAHAFGLTDEELIQIRWGALLHDIGKMGIPDGILLKPGPLTDEEWVVMRKHPIFAYEMLSPINYLRRALDIPYCHHEKWDGTGYPQRLKGNQIPLSARIFAVVDVWDALRSDRPYRSSWPDEKVYAHIRSLSGTHFDPQVVDRFLKLPR